MHRGILQLVFVAAVVVATFSEVSGAPPIREIRAKDGSEPGMTNALKYLEELDKYYSQVARPRYFLLIFTYGGAASKKKKKKGGAHVPAALNGCGSLALPIYI